MTEKYYGWGLPIDISVHGAEIDRLIVIVHIFMAVLFIGWAVFFAYTLVRFRERKGRKAEHHVAHFKLPTYAEIGVAIFEVVLLLAFSFPIWARTHQALPMGTGIDVRVVAEQYAWNVHYPGKDGVFGKTNSHLMNSGNPLGLDPDDAAGKDDITTINQLVIPVNTPVTVRLSSKDVIHSFSLPVARVKQDVIPGQMIPVTFETKRTGDFEIACAQLCGLGHYRMKGFFKVVTPEAFRSWFDEQAKQKEAV